MEVGRIGRIVKQFYVGETDNVVSIPDAPKIMPPKEKNEMIDPYERRLLEEEQRKAENEAWLKKEYERVYKEAYDAAVAQANNDINQMKDRLMAMAHNERDDMLKKAQDEVRYLNENAKKGSEDIIKQAQDQYTVICKEAYQTGFTQGFNDKAAELEKFVRHVNLATDKLKEETSIEIKDVQNQLEWLAIDIAEKILRRELADGGKALKEMVLEAVKSIRNADWITIELSEDLKALQKELKEITTNTAADTKIEVKTVAGDSKGSVVLQLEDRIIDISVFTQLGNIKEFFSK